MTVVLISMLFGILILCIGIFLEQKRQSAMIKHIHKDKLADFEEPKKFLDYFDI